MKLWETYLKNTYEMLDVLKDTGESKVLLAYDKRGRQNCVLKECGLHSRALYRTLKEIPDPHVPRVYRLIEQDGKLLVIEEYIEGRTLAEIMQSSPTQAIDEALAMDILRQLCECLAPLHERGIIHRDIKPSNLILTKDGVVKLIDFGIARTEKQDAGADTEFLGTRGYAPPEQYGFGQTDARSDIYALGVTMQRALGKEYAGRLRDVLRKCTSLDPANRYLSVDALLEAIEPKDAYPSRKTVAFLIAVVALIGIVFFSGIASRMEPSEPSSATANGEATKTAASTTVRVDTAETESATPVSPPSTEKKEAQSPAPAEKDISSPSSETVSLASGPVEKDVALQSASLTMSSPQFFYSAQWKEKVRCALFLNGEPAEGFSLPHTEWEAWRQENGDILFPFDWNLSLRIENRSMQDIPHPRIRVDSFTGEEWLDVPPIPAGQAVHVSVPLRRWSLRDMRTFTLALFFAEKFNPSEPQAGAAMSFGLRQ